MTEKQKQFLEFIRNFRDEHGYSPSVREIASGLGLSSPSSVKKMLDRLQDKGLIMRDSGTARSTTVADDDNEGMIPVIGRIKAGLPVTSEENLEGFIPIREFLRNANGGFFLIVDGESMKDKGIMDGDYAFIRPQKHISNGQVGAFRINGEVTLKTFRRTEDEVHLEPANPDFPVIVVTEHDEFEIIGRFVMLMRLVEGGYDIRPV